MSLSPLAKVAIANSHMKEEEDRYKKLLEEITERQMTPFQKVSTIGSMWPKEEEKK
jgi:hypothetical protein